MGVNEALIKKVKLSLSAGVSTARVDKGAVTQPRDLNEQVLWNRVKAEPSAGIALKGMNNDPRFKSAAGWQKMQAIHTLPDGKKIEIHYQYNKITGIIADMKVVSKQNVPPSLQSGPSIRE